MKLEPGKTYTTRNGINVTLTEKRNGRSDYFMEKIFGNPNFWNEDGKNWDNRKFDLIEEVNIGHNERTT
jgi:hypothetical protein